jgi:hypothetical protein
MLLGPGRKLATHCLCLAIVAGCHGGGGSTSGTSGTASSLVKVSGDGTALERWTMGPVTDLSPEPQALEARVVGSTGAALSATFSATATARPPTNLTYSQNPASYTGGLAITPNVPSSTGGPVVAYAVSPPFPPALHSTEARG